MAQDQNTQLKAWQAWALAARPKTLPAAAAPVIVGSAAAYAESAFRFGPALAALLAAILLQIGANLANDVFDFHKGADAVQRLGPTRVTQSGLLTPTQVRRGMWVVFGMAALLGGYLALVAGWPVVLIGLASIAAALAYTGGPFPFGYYGLGDLFVIAPVANARERAVGVVVLLGSVALVLSVRRFGLKLAVRIVLPDHAVNDPLDVGHDALAPAGVGPVVDHVALAKTVLGR